MEQPVPQGTKEEEKMKMVWAHDGCCGIIEKQGRYYVTAYTNFLNQQKLVLAGHHIIPI